MKPTAKYLRLDSGLELCGVHAHVLTLFDDVVASLLKRSEGINFIDEFVKTAFSCVLTVPLVVQKLLGR